MKQKFEKILMLNVWISKYLLIAIPFVVAVVWKLNALDSLRNVHGPSRFLYEILCWNFLIWIILLVYIIFSLGAVDVLTRGRMPK